MKIAHLIPQFYPHIGGAEVCVHNVCRTLAEKGHEAVVITTTPPSKKPPSLPYGIEYLWPKTCGLFRQLPPLIGKAYLHHALSGLQRKYQFDLWQVTNGWPLGVFAVDFFRRNKIPCILRCCGDDIQRMPEINYGIRRDSKISLLIERSYPRYDAFVANSETMKREYELLNISSKKIEIIPNGVDFRRFSNVEANRSIRNKIGAGEKLPVILTVGRKHPKKGFAIIPEIAEELKKNKIDFRWIVAGRGNATLLNGLKCPELTVVEDCGETELTGFELPSEKLVAIYKCADLFVFPSLMEGYPTVCIEAMAAGLPVVGSDSPGVRDAIHDGIDGLLVKEHRAEAYSSKLIFLLRDRSILAEMRICARKKAKSQDWNLVADRYIELYSAFATKS